MSGKLYVVGTPIGNLEDITLRAARILGEVQLVAAEDTRRSLQLLNHLGCPKPLVAYHEHNRREAGADLLRQLQDGRVIALVTDAGMPCVSDPGWELVNDAMTAGIEVEVIPGPSALATAVAASGMDAARVVFNGFPPRKGQERADALDAAAREQGMVVFYEAPHRLRRLLEDCGDRMAARPCALCKDLTKMFQQVFRGTPRELLDALPEEPKGEYVLILGPWEPPREEQDPRQVLRELLDAGMDKKAAVAEAARMLGVPKKEIYKLTLEETK